MATENSSQECPVQGAEQKTERKQEENILKEKHLTVKPYRILQETPKHSLKKTLKIVIKSETVTPLDTQIAGHGSENDGSRGMLMHKDGFVLKPVQPPPKGLREIGFYQTISSSDDTVDTTFRKFTAKYFGTEMIGAANTDEYLVLDNLTQGLSKPCVMDIKIGAKTYGPDASEAKQRSEEGKYSGTKLPLGFSVLGIIVHSGGNVHRWTKNYGRKLAASDVDEVLENYLNTGQMQKKREKSAKMIATRFLQQLEEILTLFRTQTKFHIFASSLLFVYDSSLMETEVTESLLMSGVRVRLIDFAHTFPGEGHIDQNYIFGLENLAKLFRAFIKRN